ncbi:L-serine dehydratase [Scopulibacillus darangshiensis]|uniref:L-serine deaminase n=1 Tax=Scopulibacillus darangshiensis TaxID=442528 RepID=A0A4R2P344_9BACL|nr:L-serine ammonia-lyase, iron-sulfur-dependent subunit beta [Scopulibacillus darangshiensis]TCP29140.1 L-serine dehydratase [Scopulibacillus darangshiensis]
MKYRSVFDIIGPVMIGPSSSHTAGAARIGRVARQLFGKAPKTVTIRLYGSFAKTYKGHGTDVALIGGLLDFDTFDERIVQAVRLAEETGMAVEFIEEDEHTDHPNTVRLHLKDNEDELDIVGVSVGGGKIEITELNGFEISLSGSHPALLVVHQDRYGAVATVASILAEHEVNISHMEVSRKLKGQVALMVIETDQEVSQAIATDCLARPNMLNVAVLA